MSTPPTDGSDSSDPTAQPSDEPVSFDKPAAQNKPFDPYRFGAPDHPVPPEYAPPGYVPPPATQPPAPAPAFPPTPGYPGNPGQAYPYPPPYAHAYPPPRTGNGKAIAALVLGIVSVVFCWTSILDIVPVTLAVVFGILGLNEAKRGASGRGMAITGLVCAVIGALLAVVVTVVLYQRIKPCLDSYDRGSSAYNTCIRQRI